MIGTLSIVAGYGVLVWQAGWWGLAAAAVHVMVLVVCA